MVRGMVPIYHLFLDSGVRGHRMTDSRKRPTTRPSYGGLLLGTIIVLATLCHVSPGRAGDSWYSQGWAVSVFGGPVTHSETSEIFLEGEADFNKGGAMVLALSKNLTTLGDGFGLEIEGQIAQHFGANLDYQELNLLLGLRFSDFPWSDELPTSIAIFVGPSYATAPPRLDPQDKTQWLNYLGAELALAIPSAPQWSAILRYHHRSSVFGLYPGTRDESTMFGVGTKYCFSF